jgi:hypothetical protein
MRTGSEWLSDKIQQTISHIEETQVPDSVLFIPFWRRVQLQRKSAKVLGGHHRSGLAGRL